MREKQPLGIRPEKYWKGSRIIDLSRAIYEYADNGYLDEYKDALCIWAEELVKLLREKKNDP